MIYQSTPDYYNDFVSHANHKYINKYMGKNGKWVYVYESPISVSKRTATGTMNRIGQLPNPYEAINNGMNSLRSGARRAVKRTAVTALGANARFNSYMNKKAKKAAVSALGANARFNDYMNKKAASAGKKVAGEASKAYKSAKNRATTTINSKTSAVRKNASSMYNTAKSKYDTVAGKTKSAYGSAKSAYNSAAKKTKSAYNSAKSTYDATKTNLEKAYRKERSKAAGRKLQNKHAANRQVKNWVESDAAAYVRALKKTRNNLKRKKSR